MSDLQLIAERIAALLNERGTLLQSRNPQRAG
jgi:hypothetical protein